MNKNHFKKINGVSPPKNCSLLYWHVINESSYTWTLSESEDFCFFPLRHCIRNRKNQCPVIFWGRGHLLSLGRGNEKESIQSRI